MALDEFGMVTAAAGGGGDNPYISSTTALPADVLSGKLFVTSTGALTSGSMNTVTPSSITVAVDSTGLVTASAFVSQGHVASNTQQSGQLQLSSQAITDSLTFDNGLITYSAAYTSGYQPVASSIVRTSSIPTANGGTFTPTTAPQVIASAGRYLTNSAVVAGDANLVASNIASGTSIFGVIGTLTGDMDYYKCASVNSANNTWTGYRAAFNAATNLYEFESTATTGLSYSGFSMPTVGAVYTDGGLVAATLYEGLPLGGLLCSAKPDPAWSAGQSVSIWGDFYFDGSGSQPQITTVGSGTGIKARSGDVLRCWAKAPLTDFTFLAKFYIGDTSAAKLSLIQFNSWDGAIMCFEEIDGNNIFLLSKQGVDYIGVPVNMSTLGSGPHTAAVTFDKTTGATQFYFDSTLYDTKTYNPGDDGFRYSGEFIYSQSETSDNSILGLAAYDRVLSPVELSSIVW